MQQQDTTSTQNRPREIVRRRRRNWTRAAVVVCSFLSLLVHLLFLAGISLLPRDHQVKKAKEHVSIVTFTPQAKKPPRPEPAPPVDEAKKIIETPLAKTEPPEQADFLGQTSHRAKKVQKLAPKYRNHLKNLDPGPSTAPVKSAAGQPQTAQAPAPVPPPRLSPPKEEAPSLAKTGRLRTEPTKPDLERPRNLYEQLLANSGSIMQEQFKQGYQDVIDDDEMAEGDFIDLNTQEYRYIGYFTNMRKAIELVWSYPSDAARNGIYGKVGIKFTIQKDGRVSQVIVVDSSGHHLLDSAIVDAIKNAAPFAPLPDGFGKSNLNISGTFSYVLR